MIRPLRRAHVVLWILLGVALASGLAASLAARRETPRMERLPGVGSAGPR
jgi:hypothetical protein